MLIVIKLKENLQRLSSKGVTLTRHCVSWWLAELSFFVPSVVKYQLSKARAVFWIETKGSTVSVYPLSSLANTSPQIALSIDPLKVDSFVVSESATAYVSIDECNVLVDRFVVPTAVGSHLSQTLIYEAERRLPGKVEDFFLDHRLLGHTESADVLQIEWAVVLKEHVKKVESVALRLGFSRIKIGLRRGLERKLDYIFLDRRPIRVRVGKRWGAVILSLILFSISVLYYVYDSLGYIESTKLELAAIRQQAETALKLKQKSKHSYEALSHLTTIRREINPLDVLSELTRLLPDGSWIQNFSFKDGKVQLIGYSSSASQIVEVLSSGRLVDHPQFDAPLTPAVSSSGGVNGERFEVSFRLKDKIEPEVEK